MNQVDRNKTILKKYIPESAIGTIADWIYKYNFKLKVKRARVSKAGDYTPPYKGKNHVITINRDLNKYAFLVTLIHEVAHLVTWEKHKGRVNSHGKEWKSDYSALLGYFLELDKKMAATDRIFPEEVSAALHRHMRRPSASSCSDMNLYRVLNEFDPAADTLLLEGIAEGKSFRIAGSRSKHAREVFIKGEKRRTRFRCFQMQSKREYFIHALCKVVLAGE